MDANALYNPDSFQPLPIMADLPDFKIAGPLSVQGISYNTGLPEWLIVGAVVGIVAFAVLR